MKNKIPNGWSIKTISEISDVSGGSTPKSTHPEYWNGDIHWLTPKDLTSGCFVHIDKSQRTISQDGLENGPRKLYSPGHVLMTSRAPVGIPVINDIPMAVNQGFIAISCKKIDNHFMYYWIKNNLDYLKRHSNGTTFLEISKNTFKNLEIVSPENIEEQEKISNILFILDSQIEFFTKKNIFLEKIIRSIFKSWFIDFDGQNIFKDSVMGSIPECWTVGSLHDLAEITSGKRPQFVNKMKNNFYNIPVYGASGTMGFTDELLYENRLILTGRVGTIGLIQYVTEKCFPSDNTLVIIPRKIYFFDYVFDILSNINFEFIIKGSTQPLITQTDLKNISCVIPDDSILQKFENISISLRLFIKLNKKSINNLIKIRDLLLPKLMSGEIRLKI